MKFPKLYDIVNKTTKEKICEVKAESVHHARMTFYGTHQYRGDITAKYRANLLPEGKPQEVI